MTEKIRPEYLKAAVYGANDGIITTFAVVSSAVGAGLMPGIIIVLGIANMFADAVSMGVGDFLGERSEQRLRKAKGETHQLTGLWKTGVITFVAFVLAGLMPLLPFFVELVLRLEVTGGYQFPISIITTGMTLFAVGSIRAVLTKDSWFKNGVEMLLLGAAAAALAYCLGYMVKQLIGEVGL